MAASQKEDFLAFGLSKLVLIDNYDSFTYNIVQAFQLLKVDVAVYRSGICDIEEIFSDKPSYIVIGPGPGNPASAGISKATIELAIKKRLPLLGICLGHQAIGEVFGAKTVQAKAAMHSKTSQIFHEGKFVFSGMEQGFQAVRYHSLILNNLKELIVSAWSQDKEIMGIRHPSLPIYGVQFHPESIATLQGLKILENFLTLHPPRV